MIIGSGTELPFFVAGLTGKIGKAGQEERI